MKPKQLYIGHLTTLEAVRRETARLYAVARRQHGDDLSADTAFKLGSLLQQVAKLIESSDLETRLARLEAAQPTARRLGLAG